MFQKQETRVELWSCSEISITYNIQSTTEETRHIQTWFQESATYDVSSRLSMMLLLCVVIMIFNILCPSLLSCKVSKTFKNCNFVILCYQLKETSRLTVQLPWFPPHNPANIFIISISPAVNNLSKYSNNEMFTSWWGGENDPIPCSVSRVTPQIYQSLQPCPQQQ